MSTTDNDQTPKTAKLESLPGPLLEPLFEEFKIVELEQRFELCGRCNINCSCPSCEGK